MGALGDGNLRLMPALGGLPPTRVKGRPLNGEVNPGLAGSWREFGDRKGPVVYPWQHLSLCSLSGRSPCPGPALQVPGTRHAHLCPRWSSSHPQPPLLFLSHLPPPTCQQMLLAFSCTRVQRPPCPTATTAHACLAPRGLPAFTCPGWLFSDLSHIKSPTRS